MKYENSTVERTDSFWKALDSVAKERKYLEFVEGPDINRTRRFLEGIVKKSWTQIFAIENDEVIGWCDIIPHESEGMSHVGRLGMGVVKEFRRNGVGKRLAELAILDAFSKGQERIELEVFSSNIPAIKLYEKIGFSTEGVKRKGRFIDSKYDDIVIMSLLEEEAEPVAGGDATRWRS